MKVDFFWEFEHLFAILNFCLTVLFVSMILRARRPPGNTLAWLLFVAIIPYLGIPLFIFLSNRKFASKLSKKEKLYGLRPSHIENSTGMERVLWKLGVPPATFNEEAKLFTTGEAAFAAMTKLISEAKHTINLTTFIFANDSVGQSVLALLVQKAKAGVKVRVLLDSLGAWKHPSLTALVAGGGEVGFFMPLLHFPFQGRSNCRNHRKILIVDSELAIFGGMNIATEYMGPNPSPVRWLDLCVQVKGPAVYDIEQIFYSDWNYVKATNLGSAKRKSSVSNSNELQVVASGPDVMGAPLYDALLTLIYSAQKSISIATPYFIPDESLNKALELAANRGVVVTILVPKKSNHFVADLARGTYLQSLATTGCHILYVQKMIHAKCVMVDGESALLGSANLDMRSMFVNFEIGILLTKGEAIDELSKWYSETSKAAKNAVFKANFWLELAQGVGRVLGPLI